eukprot:CAMPEP_0197620726 /NCGR_PEP_ID=MMETSP1338-20131121/1501_1 /TAXON_ID=43686 ORGANISM="Pelagodinium beii, Strain RCC1491" /NCGR_SAMPLE_ID=MMETSP1338 /ASSEMBLY_ACC=CAM_ASM_000754 /LENGTH=662 /DNA_ID=CAMNT_0043189997 /DNA_START=57 /DNA_END=2045 /DNA_ORIENTATION=-
MARVLAFMAVTTHAESISALEKVVQMLNGMKENGLKEKQEEAVQYATYKQWCSDELTAKNRELTETEDQIELLQADIATAQSNAAEITEKVAGLDSDIAKWTTEEDNSTKARQAEVDTYRATHKDYTDSIQAIMQATAALKKKATGSVAQKAMMLLAGMPKMPEEASKKMTAFLSMYHSEELVQAPEAAAYDFSGSAIIDMLEKLRDKFSDERSELEKEELNALAAHQALVQGLKNSIDSATTAKTAQVESKSKNLQVAASKQTELTDATTTKTNTAEYVEQTSATCDKKASDFQERSKLREQEQEAIEKAVTLLSGDQVAVTSSRAFLQKKAGAALALLRKAKPVMQQARFIQYLQNQAEKYNSRLLSSLAMKVSSSDDPLAKVKDMVQGLITKLQEESSQEQEHQQWCDGELEENEKARTKQTNSVDKLTGEIELAQTTIAKLTSETTELEKELVENAQSLANQTAERKKEQAENNETVTDAKAAQEAVSQAIVVIQDFYSGAKSSTALVQKDSKASKAPPVFDQPYQGQAGDGGVISMLEVIQSDYSRLETTTTAQEESAEKEFTEMEKDMAVLKTQQESDVAHNKETIGTQEQTVVTKTTDLATAQKELDAAAAYYEQLKSSCINTGTTAEERNARRGEEIESLQEALKLLDGEVKIA